MTKRVDAIILGAQKCATSTLFKALSNSPDIQPSEKKELDFFSKTPNWRDGIASYHKNFADDSLIWLEASPSYTMYPHMNLEIWDEIKQYNPEMKLIYTVRSPLERMRSAYTHMYQRGFTEETFSDFIVKNSLSIDASRYFFQICPFIKSFGIENILIVNFEEIKTKQSVALRQICDFLEISDSFLSHIENFKSNTAQMRKYHHRFDNPGVLAPLKVIWPRAFNAIRARASSVVDQKPQAPRAIEQAFLNLVASDIGCLEDLTGWDLSSWRQLPA